MYKTMHSTCDPSSHTLLLAYQGNCELEIAALGFQLPECFDAAAN